MRGGVALAVLALAVGAFAAITLIEDDPASQAAPTTTPTETPVVPAAGQPPSSATPELLTATPAAQTGAQTTTQAPTQGTAPAGAEGGGCDPSYQAVCIPISAEDYDCEGSGEDGPNFIRGPVFVIGTDVHQLDTDNDGVACVP